jgi:hypothetical protein
MQLILAQVAQVPAQGDHRLPTVGVIRLGRVANGMILDIFHRLG